MSVPPAVSSARPSAAELLPGYRAVELLSRGEEFDVHAMWSDERECLCVVKMLRPDRTGDAAARRRLLAEGRLLRKLTHPHIVRAYETLTEPRPALVLETLGGATLSHIVLSRSRGLHAVDLAHLGLQLCSAVGYLHRHGVLHLDLKPSNIVAEAGRAKILDLGFAQPPGTCPAGRGTPEYLAPEQAAGAVVGAATDVWGVGGVLYRAATRRRPFPDAVGSDGYPQLRRRADHVRRYRRLPRTLADAVDACLEPEPADRPSLAELTAVLRAVAEVDPAPR